jgi:hypothetical protein
MNQHQGSQGEEGEDELTEMMAPLVAASDSKEGGEVMSAS